MDGRAAPVVERFNKAGAVMEKEDQVMATIHDDHGEPAGSAGGVKPRQEALLGVKLRRGLSIARRGGPCTPAPAWKLEENDAEEEAGPSLSHDSAADGDLNRERSKQHRLHRTLLPFTAAATGGATAAVSARKLGANLWEIQETLQHPRMSRMGNRSRHHKNEKLVDLSDLSTLRPHEEVQSATSLRRHVEESLIQRHQSTNRNIHVRQPVSPACYSSSMEVAAYNQAVTPASSLDLKGRPAYSFKTSTELLRVLNRIWSLEEQHASNVSLVKTLKFELEHAQARIRELLKEKQSDRHEIDDLVKQITGDKLFKKNNKQERINSAVQSMRDELEEERRLRKRSESLHQKLAKELSEVKSAFSKTLKELEREKKIHKFLPYLCDEFAKGVREYEREVREVKQRSGKGFDLRSDHLVLHISEAWLDERLQMNLAEAQGDLSEKNTIMDRLVCEIEAFLKARQSNGSVDDVSVQKDTMKGSCSRRHSLESVYLNGAASAPLDAEDEDSLAGDFHYFKLNMDTDTAKGHDSFKLNGVHNVEKLEEARKSNATRKPMKSSGRLKNQELSSSQAKFKVHAQSCINGKMQFINRVQGIHARNISEGGKDADQIDHVIPRMSESGETREVANGIKVEQDCAFGSNHIIDNAVSLSEFGETSEAQPEDGHMEDSCDASWRQQLLTMGIDNIVGDYCTPSSPMRRGSYHHAPSDLGISERSSRLLQGIKENSLKARLLEARLEVQHARLKTGRGS